MQKNSELDRLRGITRSFPAFLGLRLVPVGGWFLLVALTRPLSTGVHVVLALLIAAAVWSIHRWYRRQYGVVEPPRLGLGRSWAFLIGLALALAAFGLGAARVDGTDKLVLVLVLILFASTVIFALPRVSGAGGGAMALVSGIALVAAVLMVGAARDPLGFNSLGAIFSLGVGGTFCAAGFIEHRLLTRSMKRPRSGDDG